VLLRRWALSFNPLPRAEMSCLVNFFSNFMSTGYSVGAADHEDGYGIFVMGGLCLVVGWLVVNNCMSPLGRAMMLSRRRGAGFPAPAGPWGDHHP
jgi:hypothetical protein